MFIFTEMNCNLGVMSYILHHKLPQHVPSVGASLQNVYLYALFSKNISLQL